MSVVFGTQKKSEQQWRDELDMVQRRIAELLRPEAKQLAERYTELNNRLGEDLDTAEHDRVIEEIRRVNKEYDDIAFPSWPYHPTPGGHRSMMTYLTKRRTHLQSKLGRMKGVARGPMTG
jgi:hypothetical protein